MNNLLGPGFDDVETTLAKHAELQVAKAKGEAVAPGEEAEMDRAQCEQLRLLGYVDSCDHLPN
jgi:hypothetical protein